MNQELSDNEIKEKIKEIYAILEAWVLQDSVIAKPYLKKAYAIRDNLQAMGYLIQIKIGIGLDQSESGIMRPVVEIELWKLRENLSPEDAKIYDTWLTKQRTNTSKGGPNG